MIQRRMKRTILLFTFTTLSIGHCFCQAGNYVGLYTGIGSNRYSTDVNFNDIVTYVPEVYYSVGVNAGFILQSNVLLETGLLYLKDGFTRTYSFNVMDPNDPAIPENTVFKASYVQLPISIGYLFNISNRFKLSPILGVNLQYLFSSNEESQFMDGSTRESDFFRDMNPFLIDGRLGLRNMFEASPTLALGIEPYIGKYFTIIDQPEMDSGHLTYGISCTLILKLNNAL